MATPREPTVLIVDDDPQIRRVYTMFLEDQFSIQTAKSGYEALNIIDDTIDIILLDRRMGPVSGSKVLEQIRNAGHNQPVALVTAVDPDFDILEMEFDEYILKPVSQTELRNVVETIYLRTHYDTLIREYYSLISKIISLEREKPPKILEQNTEYQNAKTRLQTIKEDANTTLKTAVNADKFEELLHINT